MASHDWRLMDLGSLPLSDRLRDALLGGLAGRTLGEAIHRVFVSAKPLRLGAAARQELWAVAVQAGVPLSAYGLKRPGRFKVPPGSTPEALERFAADRLMEAFRWSLRNCGDDAAHAALRRLADDPAAALAGNPRDERAGIARQRRARALELRRAGHTYVEVGRTLGVSGNRARELVSRALDDEALTSPPPDLD